MGNGTQESITKGISLHIGLNTVDQNHYADYQILDLIACEADADDMEAIAKAQGFSTTKLKSSEATRNAVITSIRNAANSLSTGDFFLITYSGHGGQVKDTNYDEYDNEDETWCLYDGQLIDDELGNLWADFEQGVRIFILSDSCHSGTVAKKIHYNSLRGDISGTMEMPKGTRYRYMPSEIALKTYLKNKEFYDNITKNIPKESRPIKASVRLISGCQDNQLSEDGTFNGRFTGALLQVWSGGRFQGDYDRFHFYIQSLLPPWQSPNHYKVGELAQDYDTQRPFTI